MLVCISALTRKTAIFNTVAIPFIIVIIFSFYFISAFLIALYPIILNTTMAAIPKKAHFIIKYYISKLITILTISTGLILFNNYGTYIVNLIMNGKAFSSGLGEITKITLYQLPLLYGIISLLVCISATNSFFF